MLSFFPLDVLDEIWDVIESVSEEFLTCLAFIIDFTHQGVAYLTVLYTFHTVNHLFKTRLNERDYAKQ